MTSQLSVQMCSQTTMATCLWLGNALKTAGPANPSQKLWPLRSYTMSSQLLLTLEVLHVRVYKINVQIVSTSSAFFAASPPLINTRVRCAWRKLFVDHGHSEVKAAQIHLGAVRDKLWCLWVSTNMVYKSNIPGVCFWKEKTQKQHSWCVPECLDTQIPYRIWDPGSSPRSPAFSPEPSPPQKAKPLELTWWQRQRNEISRFLHRVKANLRITVQPWLQWNRECQSPNEQGWDLLASILLRLLC